MSDLQYFIQVNPAGDIVLAYAGVGEFSQNPFPIQMRDEWGRILPYAERGSHNHGCLPVNLNGSNEIFTRIEISEEQFQLVGNVSFFHWFYNRQGRKIELRPGHVRKRITPENQWQNPKREYWQTEVIDPENLERCGIAYGGRPIYWIKWDSHKSSSDYPELLAHGMIHPSTYKPKQANDSPFSFLTKRKSGIIRENET